ncbi:MAG: hypothetical protein ACOX37_06745 [Bacillota bacterium]
MGIRFATWLLPYGIEFAAAGLALGTVCGEAVGLLDSGQLLAQMAKGDLSLQWTGPKLQ